MASHDFDHHPSDNHVLTDMLNCLGVLDRSRLVSYRGKDSDCQCEGHESNCCLHNFWFRLVVLDLIDINVGSLLVVLGYHLS
jgi:hypothetical protein